MLVQPQAVKVSAIATISSAEAYGAVAVDGRGPSPSRGRRSEEEGVDCGIDTVPADAVRQWPGSP